ncbi:MAG: hypothetical protein O7G30_13660 [Proteobacteria bacterium]|nr:hypothetical protein [Pseudomonadota bacterium]
MAKIPDPLERRHLLERELDEAQARALAEAYLEEGRVVEAVAFLQKAGDEERLSALAEEALEAGDAFLFRAACAAAGREPDAAQWQRLGDAAERAGKRNYVALARRQFEGVDD